MSASLPPLPLPEGIRSRTIDNGNGLATHCLEAGFEMPGLPCILLLHGFPELAYSWRKIMLPLAAAGFHVVAPDQRGYGRSSGWHEGYDADLDEFRLLNLVRDALGLVFALGHRSVAAVVGHDFGSPVAAWCALVRPDVFRSVVLMSAPFAGPPALPFGTADDSTFRASPMAGIQKLLDDLAALEPPRKHYQWYYSGPEANKHMQHAPQGVHAFMRGYYHQKSADWPGNTTHPLVDLSAGAFAELPTYYVMQANETMAETVASEMPSPAQIDACQWLPEAELSVYAAEYGRTGFQGGLQWYRCGTSGRYVAEQQTWSGCTIDVPSCFIAGRADWGVYQMPGQLESMRAACTQLRGVHLVDGAGHWVQQEQPQSVTGIVLDFLGGPSR